MHPTGDQYPIQAGGHAAVVTEVGATLRAYRVSGRDVVRGFGETEMVTKGRGQQLLPWPNRIRDGRYRFGGQLQQLALSEPLRHNAIHGLVRHVPWRLIEHAPDRVTQQVFVYPQPGWPGILRARLTHSVSTDGLLVDLQADNVGGTAVPFGYAAHPYLTVGEDRVDDVQLTVPADSYLAVDERLLPVAVRPVSGTEFDLRSGEPLGRRKLDTAYTDLRRDSGGRWRVIVRLGDREAQLWADPAMGWLQVFTGEDRRDLSIAVEPMTCGPDAFNEGPTHPGVIVLQPGDTFRARWGIGGT